MMPSNMGVGDEGIGVDVAVGRTTGAVSLGAWDACVAMRVGEGSAIGKPTGPHAVHMHSTSM